MPYTGNVAVGGPADVRELPGLRIAKLAVGPMDNNAYRLLELIGPVPLRAIVTTHQHWDHWQALAEVQAATGAEVAAHPEDAPELPVAVTALVQDGDRVAVGNASISVIH